MVIIVERPLLDVTSISSTHHWGIACRGQGQFLIVKKSFTRREREREKEREGGRDVAECGLRQARFVIDDARKIRENPSSSAPRFPNA